MSAQARILKELNLYVKQIESGQQFCFLQIAAAKPDGSMELAVIGSLESPIIEECHYQTDEHGDTRGISMPIVKKQKNS